jgi:hypothetical protein
MGTAIELFAEQRQRAEPTLPPDKAMMLAEGALSRAEEIDYKWAVLSHRQNTLELYRERFATKVFELVADMRERGYVPESDFEWLNFPTDLEGITRVGERLSEIGHRVRPKHLGREEE